MPEWLRYTITPIFLIVLYLVMKKDLKRRTRKLNEQFKIDNGAGIGCSDEQPVFDTGHYCRKLVIRGVVGDKDDAGKTK